MSVISPELFRAQIAAVQHFAREVARRAESPDRIQVLEPGDEPTPPPPPEPPVPAVRLSIQEVDGAESREAHETEPNQVPRGASSKPVAWVRGTQRYWVRGMGPQQEVPVPPPFPIEEWSLPPDLMPPEIFPLGDLAELVSENLPEWDPQNFRHCQSRNLRQHRWKD